MIAQIAVSSAVYAIDKPYSYNIPVGMHLTPGVRVIIPFGRGNKRCEGIVLDIQETEVLGLKSIELVLDEEPLLSETAIRLAAFLRERYFCTFYDAIKAMLPAGFWFVTNEIFSRTDKNADKARISDVEQTILSCIEEFGGQASRESLTKYFSEDIDAALENLVRKKYLLSNLDFTRKIKDKTETHVSLCVPAEQAMEYAEKRRKSAPVQYEVLNLLCAVGSAGSKELCYLTGATMQTIKRLEDLGYVTCSAKEVFRSPLPDFVAPAEPLVLTQEQEAAFHYFSQQNNADVPGVGLLYGVTGSGKTSVYISLIKETLSKGKSALFLVPEISLTPQLIGLFMSHFGDTVAVLHSALRVSERYDTWKKIKNGGSRVVVGTRSAVFAPMQNLGLVIVDEEQEHTYKSENAPRYHAREVAIYRGSREHALVLLGSATPSVETMQLAQSGVYTLCRLSTRYNGKTLPQVELVDMKEEIRNGNNLDLSRKLIQDIRKNLSDGKQTILFLNRRGAGKCMVCVDCGDVIQCPKCSVSLTYHKVNGRLMCHHCGHSQAAFQFCEKCGGHVKIIGSGTQKVEQELAALFPGVQILRMDADTLSATNNHEAILKRFEEEKVPILIGTQMVTKGLNFENVTLVGILDADMSLYVNHFRAAETTFSMLTQVIGRSGRGAFDGRAIVQTMTPEHTVLQLASKQDYDGFFDLECTLRKMQKTPPYGDIFTVTFMSLTESNAMSGAYDFRAMLEPLSGQYGFRLLGPSPASIVKVNNTYRYKLTICCKNNKDFRVLLSAALKEFGKNKKYKGISAFADINSYE